MPTISAALLDLLRQDEWPFVPPLPGEPVRLSYRGASGAWTCLASVDDDAKQVAFYSLCPVSVPAAAAARAAELFHRINASLHLGCFEYEVDTGSVRFRTSAALGEAAVDGAFLRPLLYVNVTMMDRFLPAIAAVAFGAQTPTEALAAADSP